MRNRVRCAKWAGRLWRLLDHDTPTSDDWCRKARRVGRVIGTIIDWPLARDLHFNDNSKVSGGAQAMTALLGAVIAEVAALVAFVQKKESPDWTLVALYLLLSILPLGGMISILRAEQGGRNRKKFHVFDRGAVMFGRYCVSICGATIVITAVACYAVALPGQKVHRHLLVTEKAARYAFASAHKDVGIREGDPGLVAYVRISPEDFKTMKFPDPLVIEIELMGLAAKHWEISEADSEAAEADLGTDENESRPFLVDSASTKKKKVMWPHVDPSNVHTLKIYLHQRSDGLSAEQLKEAILAHGDDGIRVEGLFRVED